MLTRYRVTAAAIAGVFAAAGLLVAPSPASAQQQQQQGAAAQAPTIKATHGDWQVRCEKVRVPVAANAQGAASASGKTDKAAQQQQQQQVREIEQCGMVQVVVDANRKNVGLNVVVLRNPNQEQPSEMRIVAPIGVFLPTGIAFEIDGKPIGRTGFLQCLPNGCLARVQINAELLTQLQKGSKANFIIYEGPGRGIGLALSLNGFTKAFNSL